MIVVKLFVISVFFIVVVANSSEYCKICLNHTLCEYPVPGPGYACTGYDASALLTRDDIINIVSRINERRNFVALGFSKLLSKAANMRKMSWSEDLAWSAQRWVDQCDAAVQPDRHDRCRNLEDTLVGQNIATIFGPSPGLNVKSFVDIWFMQTMEYSGSVSFYNESQDVNTKYFTQLIWAESDSIGCGKARFYIEYTMVERLVCNFAPSGNIHGKPVYAIGIPATQCPENWRPDETYTGLCKHQSLNTIFSLHNPFTTSLLRIVNLSNNSAKEEIPTKSDFIQSNIDGEENDDHRHHKSRHVVNNSQADVPHFLQRPMMWNSFNESRNLPMHHYQLESGQSRVYHGHNHRENLVPPYTANNQQNFRRFDVMTQPSFPVLETQGNYRRFNQPNQCTRHSRVVNCNSPVPCASDKCTRGQSHGCGVTPPCIPNVRKPHVVPHNDCPCSLPTTCSPPTSPPCCEVTCPCPCHATPSPCCPHIARVENPLFKDKTRKSNDLHYYDLLPNLALRAGDTTSEKPPTKSNTLNDRKIWLLHNIPHNTEKNKVFKHKRREYLFPKHYDQVKHYLELPDYMEEERDYINSSFDSRARRKRKLEGKTTYKPLWKMDESDNEHSMILKSLQYTTLRNRKIKHTWRTTHNSVNGGTTTEPITIELKNYEVYDNQGHVDTQHSTDKYLSFEELMRLRKLNMGEYNARRFGGRQTPGQGKPTSTSPPSGSGVPSRSNNQTSGKGNSSQSDKSNHIRTNQEIRRQGPQEPPPANYTVIVTPKLVKHCTRRLTCTWTVAMQTNKDGSINSNPIIHQGGGSRTPPGYVEGCTRTSTCTRDFMNRNKISTLPMSTLAPGEEVQDEDYCERRSLDVKKRDSNEKLNISQIVKHEMFNHVNSKDHITESNNNHSGSVKDIRFKRNDVSKEMLKAGCKNLAKQFSNPLMSYGDLYYLVLNKLTKVWETEKKNKKRRKCSCNSSDGLWNNKVTVIFLMLQNFLNVRD